MVEYRLGKTVVMGPIPISGSVIINYNNMEEAPKSREMIMQELGGLKSLILGDEEKYEKFVDFINSLKDKYGKDVEDCELFHFFSGSGLKDGHIPANFDFLGEDSIEQFARRLVNG